MDEKTRYIMALAFLDLEKFAIAFACALIAVRGEYSGMIFSVIGFFLFSGMVARSIIDDVSKGKFWP